MRRTTLLALTLLGLLVACTSTAPRITDPPTIRDIGLGAGVADSAYLPIERQVVAPTGYGLYTVVLMRSANPASVHALARLLSTTVDAREAALERRNLNLILLPVKNAGEATRALVGVRALPEGSATTLLQQHYDYGQAALLLAALCRPERGADLMKLCGSGLPDGPVLVTGQRPLGQSGLGERLLVVNLSQVRPAAMSEAIGAFRRQVLRKDYAGVDRYEHWRLWVLDQALLAAKLLPGIGKAYAGSP